MKTISDENLSLSYSLDSGILISSNAGPNKFYKELLDRWVKAGAKELTFSLCGEEIVMVRKIKKPKSLKL
jgi:hypothetical protein